MDDCFDYQKQYEEDMAQYEELQRMEAELSAWLEQRHKDNIKKLQELYPFLYINPKGGH